MKEAKIIPFKTKEQLRAERSLRHLSDHLDREPCKECVDKDTNYCKNECPTMIRKKIIDNVIKHGKSF